MKFKINIERKHLLYTVFLVAIVGGVGLGVAYNDGQPTVMGHNFNDVDLPALGAVWAGLNADQVDGLEGAALEESAEIVTAMNTHTADTSIDHDNLYVNVDEANSITTAMIQDGEITNADIAAGANIAGSKIALPTGTWTNLNADELDGLDSSDFAAADHTHTGGGSITTYRLTASSGGSAQTSSYDCPDGDATLSFCTDAGRDSNNNPYCICNTNGNTASLTAMAKLYTWGACGGGWSYSYMAVSSCTPHSGGCTGASCSGISCEMLFQCNELIDVP
jgi:hypothetical protein